MDGMADQRNKLRAWLTAEGRAGLFMALSGAHAYGFASADSDFDVRGVFVVPVRAALGIERPPEVRHATLMVDGIGEIDYVAWEIRKFCEMLLKKNGNAFEALFSPLPIIQADDDLMNRARAIGQRVLTRHIFHHYGGFYRNKRAEVEKALATEGAVRAKMLLYCYRVLLSGFSAVERGEINPNLAALAERYAVPDAGELIVRKQRGNEKEAAIAAEEALGHLARLDALEARLGRMYGESSVREHPESDAVEALEAWLVDVRLAHGGK